MSKNIDQVFIANPITSNASTDLMYFGQSPYGAGNDAAMTYANFSAQFGAPYTPAALTEVNDTNVTLTLGGSPSTALLHATSITAGWSGQLSLARGGTNANLTASAGAVAYSSASAIALSAVGSSGQLFQSTGTTAPGWTTNTYPSTDAKGDIHYASAANTISGLAIGSTGNVLTVSAGLPAWAAISTIGTINTINGDSGSVTPTSGAVTISGGTTGLTTSGSSSTLNLVGTLNLSHGGTNSSLTANNGGIFYSTASAAAILSGTATANQVLLSGSSTTPAWSTATYPATTTINQILYSSSANTIGGLATANSAVLTTNSSGVPAFSGTMTNGQLIIGSTGATPTAATLSQGTGISITNGAASITIASNGANPWVDETGSNVTMATNTGYTSDDGASLVTFTLPTTSAIGDWIEINGKGSGGWSIAQATGQQIHFGSSTTTSGATGSLSSTNQYDCVRLRCITANTIWVVASVQGILTVV